MKILITGGMGFVGTPMVRCLSQSHDITVIDRLDFGISPELRPLLQEKKITLIEKNILEAVELHCLITQGVFDLIIHLAALHYIPACENDPVKAYTDNLLSSLVLLKNLPAGMKFLNFSTSSVYCSELIPHREDKTPLEPCDIYGWTKKNVEDLAHFYARQKKLSVVNIRLFNAVGPGETNPHVLPTILAQLQNGASTVTLGNLTPKRDFIHIEDIAWAIEALIKAWPVVPGCVESFNLGSGIAISVEELFSKVARYLGRPITIKSVAERKRRAERPLLCADTSKLKLVLPHFKPQSCDQWLSRLVGQPAIRIDTRKL